MSAVAEVTCRHRRCRSGRATYLPQIVGPSKAAGLLFTGDTIDAAGGARTSSRRKTTAKAPRVPSTSASRSSRNDTAGRTTVRGQKEDELLHVAARNNAEWCDAVCRVRGIAGAFTQHLWVCARPTPPYYPNIITLQPSSDELLRELATAIERVRANVGDDLSIKDSFADIDLAAGGLRVLFDAHWIGRPTSLAGPEASTSGIEWSRVRTESELDEWKRAWDAEILATDPVFDPALLGDERIAFIAGRRGGAVVAGAIVNRMAGVAGLSNVFAAATDPDGCRAACIREAMQFAPRVPLVGYETGGELASATALGFEPISPLRVWVSGSVE